MAEIFMGVEQDMHYIKLKQMGAKVEVIRGIMHYVQFDIEGTKVKYVYHINKKGRYFLERATPYPLNVGTYESQEDVIETIKHDIAQIRNAKNSKKFQKFIDINKKVSEILRNFEDLYLYYNVSRTQAEKIGANIDELQKLILETKDMSERIYFEKDPDSI